MSTLLQTLLGFILTGVLGTWLAYIWQNRSLRESRHYEASRKRYELMLATTQNVTGELSKRIYALQRVVLNFGEADAFEAAMADHAQSTKEWNEKFMSFEIAVKSYFQSAYASDLEHIQESLASISRRVSAGANAGTFNKGVCWADLVLLRRDTFVFVREMVEEAKLLDRQIHFGVRLTYDRESINRWSTQDLIKALFAGRVEGQAIIRSAGDFGLPVSIWEARLGINE